MGSGGGGGGDGGRERGRTRKPKKRVTSKAKPKNTTPFKAKPRPPVNPAKEARTGRVQTPAGFSAGVAKAKFRGPSPLDVKATFGAVGDLSADQVAANVAGFSVHIDKTLAAIDQNPGSHIDGRDDCRHFAR